MYRFPRGRASWALALALLAAPRAADACAVCLGKSEDPSTRGLNAAIVTLVAALLCVMGPIVGFIGYLTRRAIIHPLPRPDAPGGVEHDGLD